MTNEQTILDIAWFKRTQWSEFKALCVDSEHLQDTYEEWEAYAIKIVSDLEKQGKLINKVTIDVNEFRKWCDDNKKPKTGRSRAEYASLLAQNAPNK